MRVPWWTRKERAYISAALVYLAVAKLMIILST